jgi:hypothetical protein
MIGVRAPMSVIGCRNDFIARLRIQSRDRAMHSSGSARTGVGEFRTDFRGEGGFQLFHEIPFRAGQRTLLPDTAARLPVLLVQRFVRLNPDPMEG